MNHIEEGYVSTDMKDTEEDTQMAIKLQLFPHSDVHIHNPPQYRLKHFTFNPVEVELKTGFVLKIGRKVDRGDVATRQRPTTRQDRAANNVSIATDAQQAGFVSGQSDTPTVSPNCYYLAFRSKVVSRSHAELWIGKDGMIYFRDVGSSSGTFLNRLRLSPSGKDSRPYAVKSGDVIQLGVDYQNRNEEIYKAVVIKIFASVKTGVRIHTHPARLQSAMRSMISAMNPNSSEEDVENTSTDCCICLNSMTPLQALFLAPCSHCFHYKCVIPLLGAGYMFQCPLCRQVANLDASVAIETDDTSIVIEKERELDGGFLRPGDEPQIQIDEDVELHGAAVQNTSTLNRLQWNASSETEPGRMNSISENEQESPDSSHTDEAMAGSEPIPIQSTATTTNNASDNLRIVVSPILSPSTAYSTPQPPTYMNRATVRTSLTSNLRTPEGQSATQADIEDQRRETVYEENFVMGGTEAGPSNPSGRNQGFDSSTILPAITRLGTALQSRDGAELSQAIEEYARTVTEAFGDLQFLGSQEEANAVRQRLIASIPFLRDARD